VSASKAKGTAAETAVVRFLQANGYPHAERRALAGSQDRGDVAGIPGLVVEVKDRGQIQLGEWLKEAQAEARWQNGQLDIGVVWHKRRGKSSPGQWYVTMDGATFLALLERWTDASD
jgi:hypothetical protein